MPSGCFSPLSRCCAGWDVSLPGAPWGTEVAMYIGSLQAGQREYRESVRMGVRTPSRYGLFDGTGSSPDRVALMGIF
jgi:hypothetical protein